MTKEMRWTKERRQKFAVDYAARSMHAFEPIAAQFVLLGFEKKFFLECAGRVFDYTHSWLEDREAKDEKSDRHEEDAGAAKTPDRG